MDSAVTDGYDNSDDATNDNKQVDFPTNSVDFSHDNFTSDGQIAPANFQIPEDPYEVQPTAESTYNSVESVQQLPFGNQDHQNLENIVNQTYYSETETQFQNSYISEEQSGPEVVNSNNEMSDPTFVVSIDDPNSVPEQCNTEVNEGGSICNEQAESTEIENGNLPVDEVTEKKNGEIEKDEVSSVEQGSSESIGEEKHISNKETEQSEKEVKKVEIFISDRAVSNIGKTDSEKEIVTAGIEELEHSNTVESNDNTPQYTEMQTYEPEQDHYTIAEEITRESPSSSLKDHYIIVEENESDNISAPPEEHTVVEEYSEEKSNTSPTELTKSEEEQENEVIEISHQKEVENSEHKKKQDTAEKKQRRTRKPVHDLPMHLLGHNISKPVEAVTNGRALPKPRLGVKVPYRNLTSQIVSKAELEEEILERARAKELAIQKGDVKFARSLTQRLANKIAPDREKKYRRVKKETTNQIEQDNNEPENASSQVSSNSAGTINESKIQNDDDLLAILEGEGEEMPILPNVTQVQTDDSSLKLLEREIALQQLQELPHQEPKEKILKPRFSRGPLMKVEASLRTNPERLRSSNNTTPSSSKPSSQKITAQSVPKSNILSPIKKSSGIDLEIQSPIKKVVEIEPQVKVNMVLKTYSRKRKPSDVPDLEIPSPKKSFMDESDAIQITDKNDPLALPTDVYITKSSRVIKKKVIWDPDDEQTSRGTKPTISRVESNKIIPIKAIKPMLTPEKKLSEKQLVDECNSEETVVKSPSEKETPKKAISKKSPINKPKRGLSEVDKLLMDEGAVKMLYDLKGEESTSGKKKKDVYSVEKAEKEIIKKANLLKNDLVQNTSNESPKSLRKKEGTGFSLISPPSKPNPISERKMSKDSTKSSVVSPPRSPAFQFSSQSSMLIRRRSSSSISSEDMEEDFEQRGTRSSKKSETPKIKKQRKNTCNEDEIEDIKEKEKTPAKDTLTKSVKGVQYKSFTMRKSGKHVCFDLNYIDDDGYFTITVLEELIAAFKKIEKDKECNVVSLTSTSKSFCLGLDYSSLVASEHDERIQKATELAETVRQFLLCLLHFPKILVAGIQGDCVGLGVTMLTLFDTVIASDTATFSTPYANYGCLGEATFLLTYPNISNNGLTADLLYASQKLTADEAFRRGLISKLCWPEKYNDTLKTFLNSVAKGSRQCLETTKKHFRTKLYEVIEAAIETEIEVWIEHWISAECQENFSKIGK